MRLFLMAVMAALFATAAVAQDTYRINPGDRLAIEVLQDPSLNREVLILPDGSFSFPFAGTLRAGGRTVDQVQDSITQAIAPNFAVTPNVFVTVLQTQAARGAPGAGVPVAPPTIDIYFLGEVNSPGVRAVEPGTTLLQALSTAGGFTNFAALRRIQLRRSDPATGEQHVSEINYRAISNGARLLNDVVLIDGDVILVPERRLFE
jgi:polysaccharide export outer membrane protein